MTRLVIFASVLNIHTRILLCANLYFVLGTYFGSSCCIFKFLVLIRLLWTLERQEYLVNCHDFYAFWQDCRERAF